MREKVVRESWSKKLDGEGRREKENDGTFVQILSFSF